MIKKSTLLVLSLALILSFTVTATELRRAQVVKVIGGNIIRVRMEDDSGILKTPVRYIGTDIPGTYQEEATDYNKNLVEEKTVWLEIGQEEKDESGRLLAYVYLDPAKKSMVNAILLAQGYAETMTIPPNVKYADTFKELEKDAKEGKRGFWFEEPEENGGEKGSGLEDCINALNNATQEDFEEIHGIGEGVAKRLVDAQPYDSCDDVSCIKANLMDVGYVGKVRSEDILTHFCPELVE